MFKRLDVQILLVLSLILALTIAVFGWIVGRRQGDVYVSAVTQNARVLAVTHARNAAHYLVINEYAGLEEHMLEAAQLPNVLALQVIEPDGRLLCNIVRSTPDAAPRLKYHEKSVRLPTGGGLHLSQDGSRLACWAPIEEGKLGWLKMSFSLEPVREMWKTILISSLVVGGLAFMIGIGLMVLVLRRPGLAIRRLSSFAHNLDRNKGETVTVPDISCEINQLGAALNYASNQLYHTERQLLAERERLAVTLRSLGEGVVACDRNDLVILLNRAGEEMTGWSSDRAAGIPLSEVMVVRSGDEGEVCPADGGNTLTLVATDGSRRSVTSSSTPLVNGEGEEIGRVVVFRDETENLKAGEARRELEEQLRQSQKMEAVGQLAGGIAHDFNNILTAIIGYTTMLVEQFPEDGRGRDYAHRVLQAAERAAGLTRGLLSFSRKQKVELQPCDLNVVVHELEKMLRRIIGEDIRLTTELCSTPVVALADVGQIEQVLLNLVTNARDAMPHGGLIGISVQEAEFTHQAEATGSCLSPHGRCALICVSDSGAGMPPELLGRIFEPFFTTKLAGKGTGLGLAIVDGIVQQHSGVIRVYSNSGIGTTFKIYLPLAVRTGVLVETADERKISGGDERILLVEDETDVRQVVRIMLSDAGYRVLEAINGVDALRQMRQEEIPFDMVVSDVIMPEMTGKELRDLVVAENPNMKFLFISGYTADVVQYKGIVEEDVDLLMKPFSSSRLLEKVREQLDR